MFKPSSKVILISVVSYGFLSKHTYFVVFKLNSWLNFSVFRPARSSAFISDTPFLLQKDNEYAHEGAALYKDHHNYTARGFVLQKT